MAERFTRAYTLPEGLYSPGAPVLVAAGALLKDNQTGQMLAQLKIKNISAKEIKAATVKLTAFDTAGRKLEAGAEQQYLDLKIGRDNYFGETVPIVIADNSARSYEVAVTEVVFADNTIWSGNNTPWQKQITLTPLSETLTDPELITQYAINLEKEIGLLKCVPQEQENLWICTCGAINHKEEAACHNCKSELNTLKAMLDIKKLEADKNARLEAVRQKAEAEAKEKAEQAAKSKAKIKKTTKYAVCAVVVAVAIGVGISTFRSINLKNAFEEAIATQKIGDTISAGYNHTVGLKSNGTVVVTGDNDDGQCNVEDWKGIIAVSAGDWHTVGLKADGTAVATGAKGNGQCKVSGWKDVIAVSAGNSYTVGLRSDGTVVATGINGFGQCNVSGWTNIVAISAGYNHTVGLKSDGTVVAIGYNNNGQCNNVENWTDIIAVSAGQYYTVGLKSNGTVVATGDNEYGQCDVEGWTDIVAISTSYFHTVGLKSDGTVVATGKNSSGQCKVSGWKGIIAVSAGDWHTAGLKSDGTVVATGKNSSSQCNVSAWKNIMIPGK